MTRFKFKFRGYGIIFDAKIMHIKCLYFYKDYNAIKIMLIHLILIKLFQKLSYLSSYFANHKNDQNKISFQIQFDSKYE